MGCCDSRNASHPISEKYESFNTQIEMNQTVNVPNVNISLTHIDEEVDILAAAIISGYIEKKKQKVKDTIFELIKEDLENEIPNIDGVSDELKQNALKKVQQMTVGDVIDDAWDIILVQFKKRKKLKNVLTKQLTRQFSQLVVDEETNDDNAQKNENIKNETENKVEEEKSESP
eukprot:310577_1